MSMMYCHKCDRQIDTDYDAEHEHFEELKTLKDFIRKKGEFSGLIFPEELKAEAVKRIKSCQCCKIYGVTKIYDNNKLVEEMMKKELCFACERDKWFNNLTEEDLK